MPATAPLAHDPNAATHAARAVTMNAARAVTMNAARAAMIHSQLQPSGVIDQRLLKAIAEVRREGFVAPGREGLAYVDDAVAIGGGRALMPPLSFGLLMQRLLVGSRDRVLVVGAGTGWSAAVVARIAGHVVALESDAELAARARELLTGTPNLSFAQGPLVEGWAAGAPYDVILVDGAIARLPQSFADQLPEGGRLAAIVAGSDGVQRASIAVKAAGRLLPEPYIEASAPPLPGFQPAAMFRF